jgi:hypothetical protein
MLNLYKLFAYNSELLLALLKGPECSTDSLVMHSSSLNTYELKGPSLTETLNAEVGVLLYLQCDI